MLDRFFGLSANQTSVRTELLAGLATFLTMAYIIFVQPAVLSGASTGTPTGMDFGAITTATCLSAALATIIMGVYGKYPIAQAPGMGENFFFVFSAIPAAKALIDSQIAAGVWEAGATSAWQIALGVVFLSGVIFLILSLCGVRQALLGAISPSMRNGIAIGIGLFIAFIGFKNAGLIVASPGTFVQLNCRFGSPDLIVFFLGLFCAAGLLARRVRGAILWGILASLAAAAAFRFGLPCVWENWRDFPCLAESQVMKQFSFATGFVSLPPSMEPTFLKMDLAGATTLAMLPFVLVFLFMLMFDTLGTLIGVAEQAGLMKNGELPRAKQSLVSDALATVAGAAMGTSTVTSFIESAAGVEQGGRTGLTAITTAALFLLALFFSPIIAMVGQCPPITAPALVVVGSMMIRNVTKIDWSNDGEAIPAFLVMLGIPLTFSIADGLALGLIAYPAVKWLGGQRRDVKPLMYILSVLLIAYFFFVRMRMA